MKIKHLASYLPYELNFIDISTNEKYELINLAARKDTIFINGVNLTRDLKLILRPLSDLTKEIEVNGEKFIPYEKMYSIPKNLNLFVR